MDRQAWPLVAPFLLFELLLVVESWFPDHHYLLYPVKTVIVGALILWYGKSLPDLRPSRLWLSILVGILGVVLWIGLDPYLVRYDQPLLGRNPFQLYPAGEAWLLFAFRVVGIALIVPVMEELFWRAFLMRWLISENFTQVPLGTYRPFSFLATTACFAAVHGEEWPLAVIVGLLYGAWFVRTKNLGNIIAAHAATNFLLIFYSLASDDWHFISRIAPAK